MPGMILLAGEGRSTWVVARALLAVRPDLEILIEAPEPRGRMLRRRLARLGPLTVAGQVLFLLCAPLLARRAARRGARILAEAGLDDRPLEPGRYTRIENANAEAVIDWLRRARPELVVVNGTRILSRRVLAATDAPFVNIHAGITPRYRGVHGGYWARVAGDPEHCGVTVHLVDAGVDTGAILHQARIAPGAADSYFTYPMLQLAAGIPLLLRAVEEARSGRLAPRPPEGESRQWYHPTLWGYVRTGLRTGIW